MLVQTAMKIHCSSSCDAFHVLQIDWILNTLQKKSIGTLLLTKKTSPEPSDMLNIHTPFSYLSQNSSQEMYQVEQKCQGRLTFSAHHTCYIFAVILNCIPLLSHGLQRQHLPLKSDALLGAFSPTSTQHSSKVTRSGT